MLPLLDIAATMVFALTGALAASRKQMDVIGFMWFATITGVGGGTLRDLLIGASVFWVHDPTPILICWAVAFATHFTAHLLESRYRYILWFDALGIALVTVAGTSKALMHGLPAVVCVTMGVITACFGGIIRDTLSQEPSVIMRKEIYVSASVLGAISFLALNWIGADRITAISVGVAVAAVTRLLAISFEWSFPTFKPRAARPPDQALEDR